MATASDSVRTRLIFNPHAYRGRAWESASLLRAVVQRHPAEWAEYPGHATALAEQAARDGCAVVTAIGRAGTVHEVATGLLRVPAEDRPDCGIAPVGSGNDLSVCMGVAQDPETAKQRVFSGSPCWADLGLVVDGAGRREYFTTALGIGFDAQVTFHSYRIACLKGFSMHLWAVIQTILRNRVAPRMRLTFDDETFGQDVLMLVLCDGPREGGGVRVAPEALPDDGLLHDALVRRVSRLMMFRLIPEVMRGTHGRFAAVRLGPFRELQLKSELPMTIHCFTSDVVELQAQVVPRALQVLA